MLQSLEASPDAIAASGLYHRVYQPATRGSEPGPGVLFVHGRAGDATVMWVFSKALEGIKPSVVAPQAPESESIGGYSWWSIEKHPPGEALSPREKIAVLEPAIAKLETFIDSLPEVYNIDPHRLYAAGFSQGAGLIASLVVKHPQLFRGVALLSGFVPKTVQENPLLLNPQFEAARGKLPAVFVFHGSEDEVLPLSRGEEAGEFFASRGAVVTFCQDAVGHKVSSAGIKALRSWFEQRMR